MSFRSETKRPAAAAVLCAMLGPLLSGCSDIYYDRRDPITLVSGEAMAANRVTHVIDPWPPYAANRNIAYNGEKAAAASERYRTGRVIPPVHATTSSASYQAAPQTQSTAVSTSGNSATR